MQLRSIDNLERKPSVSQTLMVMNGPDPKLLELMSSDIQYKLFDLYVLSKGFFYSKY